MKPDLTVCVSCKGLMPELCFKALARQKAVLWEALLLIPEADKPSVRQKILRAFQESFAPPAAAVAAAVLTGKSKHSLQNLRNQAFEKAQAPILLFLDEDVILENPDHFQTLISLHAEHPDIAVIGGGYLNKTPSFSTVPEQGRGPPPQGGGMACAAGARNNGDDGLNGGGLTFWGRAYNETVRFWTALLGYSPAGNLSVKKALTACRFKSFGGFFGGEESHFFHQLQRTGGRFLQAEAAAAPHLARHNFRDFIARALVHGRARAAFAASIRPGGGPPRKSALKTARRLLTAGLFNGPPPPPPPSPLVALAAVFYLALVRLTCLLFSLIALLKSPGKKERT